MRKSRKEFVSPPGPGRNAAVRPGAGAHTPAKDKRARDRLRHEIEERREDEREGP